MKITPNKPTLLILIFIGFLFQSTAFAATLEVSVNHDADDAEENGEGEIDLNSSDLEMTHDGADEQTVGIRFNSISIPQNSVITNAYIRFHADETDGGDTNLTLYGEADDASRFVGSKNNITNRTRTDQSVGWAPQSWNNEGDVDDTPDLKDIVQEIINRNGWNTNNSIVFIITGSGTRVADSYDGSENKAPLLHIEYTTPPGLIQKNFGVSSDSDDAEEGFNGKMESLYSSDLEMTEESSTQKIGIRFDSITIPKNVTITNAYIQFHVDELSSEATDLDIYGQAHDSAPTFTSSHNDISDRTLTDASINWLPDVWDAEGDPKNTPNLKSIVQNVINRSGWSSGNSMVFIITGTGKRVADSYDGNTSGKPRLFVEYSEDDPDGGEEENGEPECAAIFEDDFESGMSDKWRVLKEAGEFTPAVVNVSGDGRLRLTDRSKDLSTAVTLDYQFPSSHNTFVLEFDYYAYGGCSAGDDWKGANDSGDWGGDGMSVILFDSSVGRSPRVGALGGSLGYANAHTEASDGPLVTMKGFESGWFGIGLDEFGNFKTNDEARRGIDGVTSSQDDEDTEVPNSIAIRGSAIPANGTDTGYRLLASTNTLESPLARLLGNDSSYLSGRYRLTINMTIAGSQMVKLERKKGSVYVTVIDEFDALLVDNNQGITPEQFRIAFSSGTGGACNNHEIDNVKICGSAEEYVSTNAVCWATTDDAKKIYKIDPDPTATTLPESVVVETNRILRAEGGAFRPTDRYVYKFDDDGETYNSHENDDGPDSLYKINTITGQVSLAYAALVEEHVDAAEFYINPETQEEIFYVIERERILHAFDPLTWQELQGYPKEISGEARISGLAINSLTGDAYGMDDYSSWSNTRAKLYTFNLQTAEATFLLTLQADIDAEGLAFADDGNLYVENEHQGIEENYKKIFKISLADGSLTPAASFNVLNGDIETFSCNGGYSLVGPLVDPPVDPVFDYGDAPESYFAASHVIPANPTIYLGTVAPDTEIVEGNIAYPYDVGAVGDDTGDTDDEDGVQFNNVDIQGQRFTAEQTYTFVVRTHGNGYLNAWIDWNANGIFESSEQVSSAEDGSSGSINLSVPVPTDAVVGSTYARFRYSSRQSLLPAGPANDGEVEDYTITIAEGVSVCSIDDVTSAIYSTAAVTVNSDRLNTNTRLFQTQFNNATWEGYLLSYDLEISANDGNTKAQKWNAADQLPAHSARNIFSYNPLAANDKGIEFNWASLNATQKTALQDGGATVEVGQKRLNWLRGQQTFEKTESNANGLFRPRSKLLGDIIHSSPIFSGKRENFGYAVLSSEGSSYPSFLSNKLSRQEVVYLGANDGMLHAFNANTGAEIFAYVPNAVMSNLAMLTSIRYGCKDHDDCTSHQAFVDGKPAIGDAYFDNTWHTVLLGTLGKGGKGLFALDVTDPDSFAANKVLWEVSAEPVTASNASAATSSYNNHLGYSTPEPSIARLNDGSWVAVVGNGYGSKNNTAVLFLINAGTGELIKAIDTGAGSSSNPNGLSSPIAVDTNGDRKTDTVYAGDLLGNMWKFDLSNPDSDNWSVAFHDVNDVPVPLFTSCESTNCTKRQAITAKPQVGRHPAGGYMVYFGTGKYYGVGDNVMQPTPDIHTLYGIRDNGSVVSGLGGLIEQSILQESEVTSDLKARITSSEAVDYSTKSGWYMKLVSPSNSRLGERIISKALLRGGRLIVTTIVPPQNSCVWGGSSWIMELNAVDGRRLQAPPLDINNDKQFTAADNIDYDGSSKAVSGIQKTSLGLILSTPEIINHTPRSEGKYVSGTSGHIGMFRESTGGTSGRQSWKQIR